MFVEQGSPFLFFTQVLNHMLLRCYLPNGFVSLIEWACLIEKHKICFPFSLKGNTKLRYLISRFLFLPITHVNLLTEPPFCLLMGYKGTRAWLGPHDWGIGWQSKHWSKIILASSGVLNKSHFTYFSLWVINSSLRVLLLLSRVLYIDVLECDEYNKRNIRKS